MADPGAIGSIAPAGEDYLVKRIAALETKVRELGPSIATSFNGTVQQLAQTVANLAALTTTSAFGTNFNTGTVPGDSTFRWFDSSPALTLTTQCATGKLLVTAGTGQCTLASGSATAVGALSFVASTPSGWNVALDAYDSRVFFANGSIGVPLLVNAPLHNVPTTETITITVKYGIWSSSTTSLASAQFSSNYLIAQVTN